jgi:hypothetical protein
MIPILQRFFDICRLRLAPQDLPSSSFLLGLSLLLYAAVGLLMALQSLPVASAVTLTLVDALLLAGMLWALLWVRDLLVRFQQSLTALYGAGAVMQALAAPLVLGQPPIAGAETVTTAMMVISLLLWLWLLWNLMVIGHILRHTISTSLPVGMMLGLLYVFVSFSVTRSLFFPEASG